MATVCRRSSSGSWVAWARGLDQVAMVGLEWVDWFNHRRLHSAVRRRSTCRVRIAALQSNSDLDSVEAPRILH